MWEISRKRVRSVFRPLHTDFSCHIDCIDISPDGRLIACVINSCVLQIWNCRDGSRRIFEDLGDIKDIRFNPDGQYIAGALDSGDVLIWNVRMGQLVEKLMGDCEWVASVAFMPDGTGLVSGGSDGTVKLWDMNFLKIDGPGTQPQDGDNSTGKELNFGHNVRCFCLLSTDLNSLTVFFSFPPRMTFALSLSRPMVVGWSLAQMMEYVSGTLTMLSCIVS